MDGATCNVLYVDRNVREDGIASARKTNPTGDGASPPQQWAEGRTLENINLLIEAFGEGECAPLLKPKCVPLASLSY